MRLDQLLTGMNKILGVTDVQSAFEIVSFAFFLRKCELNGLEACKEQYSLSYLSLIYGERMTDTDLFNYCAELENELGIKDRLISESLINALRRVSISQIVRDIFDSVYSASNDPDVNIAELYDAVLDSYQDMAGRNAGEFGGNRSLAKLEGALLNAKDNCSIYDGYCGMATSIVEAGNNTNKFYIRDMMLPVLSKAVINLYIHDRPIESALCGDSNIFDGKKYDYIISEPPFSIKRDLDYMRSVDPEGHIKSRESLEVERMIEALKDNGRAVILVPAGILFSMSSLKDFREALLQSRHVETIVGLKPGAVMGSMVSAMLLVIDKSKEFDNILMVDTSDAWEGNRGRVMKISQKNIDKISEIVRNRQIKDNISVLISLEEIRNNALNMTPAMYVHPYNIKDVEVADISALILKSKQLTEELGAVSKKLEDLRS